MKTQILIIFLFLGVTSWSQEEPKTAPVVRDSSYVYQFVDIEPEFPGGKEALFKYLSSNIEYPARALKKKISGKCYLQFIVNADGTITNSRIIRGVPECPECDAEALRVVSAMPKWKPGEIEGKPVRSTFNLPIMFKL